MEYVKAEVLDAIVDGKRKGAQIEIDRRSAEYLAGIGYIKIIENVPQEQPKAQPKKPAAKKAAAKKSEK